MIDFETDRFGEKLGAGSFPKLLPHGVVVSATRRRGSKVRGTSNDQVIITSQSSGKDTGMNVVAINKSKNRETPDENDKGGFIEFLFTEPVHRVNSITMVGITKPRESNANLVPGGAGLGGDNGASSPR